MPPAGSDRRFWFISQIPFIAISAVGWCAVLVGQHVDPAQYVVSWILLGLAGLATFATLKGPHGTALPAGLIYLGAVALLRNSAGGITAGVQALFLVPVFCTALYTRSWRQLSAILTGVAIGYLVPIVVIGGARYPDSQYRAALLSVLVLAVVGFVTQALVRRIAIQAEESRQRQLMLEEVAAAVHHLLESRDARTDACLAAMRISRAAVVALSELDDSGQLVCSTLVGVDDDTLPGPAKRESPSWEVFRSGVPSLVTVDAENRVGNRELWERAGQPGCILYQPLLRGERTVGVLVVGWAEREPDQAGRCAAVSLLAHTVASVLERADVVETLTGEAQTDPLTGLPNRRAWDTALEQALRSEVPLIVAMIDIDHFKRFNDTHGHPAGDRLLKASAAAWREEIRADDVLARVGGEEFGLLLRGGRMADAEEILKRLRLRVPDGQTCSAGVALRGPAEQTADLMARVDAALYAAKAAGRDRVHTVS